MKVDFIKIREALSRGTKILRENNIEEASLQTRILLSSILVCHKEELVIKDKEELERDVEDKFFKNIEKISKGYPIQYITNNKEFMGMKFYIDENVLIPRSDTEILVEEVIKICQKINAKKILELCTGSGVIAISLKKYLDKADITATDISKEALNIAKKNKRELLNNQNIKFIKCDMFEGIEEKFDIIVSNPPYIKTETIKQYNLEYEPRIALDGGEDGLNFYKTIIEQGYKHLNENGYILLEIGYDQKDEVIDLVERNKRYDNAYCIQDLCGNDRVIVIKKSK